MVRVHLVGYTGDIEVSLEIVPLSASLSLALVHDVVLDPPAATLYHHTHNKVQFYE